MVYSDLHPFNSIQFKNILTFNARPLWELHYLMELAILSRLGSNNNIYYGECGASFDICGLNFEHKTEICQSCLEMQKRGKNYLDVQIGNFYQVDFFEKYGNNEFSNIFNDKDLSSIEKLSQIKYKEFEVGKAVINAIVPTYGVNCDFSNPQIIFFIKKWLTSAIEFYESTINIIKDRNINLLLVFNGRFPHEAAMIASANYCKIEFLVHERGSTPKYIGAYLNDLPHHTWNTGRKAINIRLEDYSAEKIALFREFAVKPHKSWSDQHFTQLQVKSQIPQIEGKLITIFLSTEEEFVAVPGIPSEPRTIEVLETLLSKFKDIFAEYSIVIRDHPHSARFPLSHLYQKLDDKYKNVYYFPPASEVDTYALVERSELVMTFGSTVGLEALNVGKKVICLSGQCIYFVNMPGVLAFKVEVGTHEELCKFISLPVSISDCQKTLLKLSAAYISNDIYIKEISHVEGYSFKLDGF